MGIGFDHPELTKTQTRTTNMKLKYIALLTGSLYAGSYSADAALVAWQNEVTGSGATAAATLFTTVNGAAPQNVNVGALTGARTFEFIVNSGGTGGSQALLGDRITGGNTQGIKFEQWNNTGNYGITNFGVADLDSGVANTTGTDIHLVFASNGTDTTIYQNGAAIGVFSGNALTITGNTAIGAAGDNGGVFFDNLDGNILGFASYDSELSGAEIAAHSAAFFAPVPEPSSTALLGLGGLALILRRRK